MELMNVGSLRRVVKAISGKTLPVVPEPVVHAVSESILQGILYLH